MTNHEELVSLIRAYCKDAAQLLARLKENLGTQSPMLHALRSGEISRAGEAGGIKYQIHGGGISMSHGDIGIDVELGQLDFAQSFDAWRLSQYAENRGAPFENYDELQRDLAELCRQGIIQKYDYLGDGFYMMNIT